MCFMRLSFRRTAPETRILSRDRAVDLQTGIGPVPDPIAVVQIGMAGVSVAHKRFVMAAAGAQRPRPARVAIVLRADVAAVEEIVLLFASMPVEMCPSACVSESTKRWHGAMSPERSDAQQTQARAAGMRLVDALAQLGQGVADIRESVHFAAQRILQILVGQHVELFQHAVHARLVDGVQPIGRRSDRREADFVEAEILLQMPEDADHIGDAVVSVTRAAIGRVR